MSVSIAVAFLLQMMGYLHALSVFINDYHLLLVPEMLREKIPDAPIGLFLHATFPSSEIFRCLTSKYSKGFVFWALSWQVHSSN